MMGRHGVHGLTQGKVEIAVKKGPVPSHADLVAAHQLLEGEGIERLAEQPQVRAGLVPVRQFASEPAQGDIGDGKQAGEADSKTLTEFPLSSKTRLSKSLTFPAAQDA